jgi:hypothetical protein
MSGAAADRKRLIRVTAGNIRNQHIYVADHLDFFPSDVLGSPRRKSNGNGRGIEVLSIPVDEADQAAWCLTPSMNVIPPSTSATSS